MQVDGLGKATTRRDARKTMYDGLIRYARTMEAKLGTRHPRYQAQRALLGDFIKSYLMDDGKPPEEEAPAGNDAAPAEAFQQAQARYEALFAHYWVDHVIDATERAALAEAAGKLGLPPEQARAIEAKVTGAAPPA